MTVHSSNEISEEFQATITKSHVHATTMTAVKSNICLIVSLHSMQSPQSPPFSVPIH